METRDGITPHEGNGAEDSSGAQAGPGDSTSPMPDSDAYQDLSRRERERLVRRQLMLDAARAVFAEKGYADATLDEIAQRAEFGKGTLYNYFEGGKEEILFAVFDDLHAGLHQLIARTFSRELTRDRPFRAVFEGFLTALFSFFIERQDQFMIMMKEGHRMAFGEDPEKSAYFMRQGERIIEALIPAIEEAQRRGAVRDFPPVSIAHMIMGNVKGYHMHQCMAICQSASGGSRGAPRSAAGSDDPVAGPGDSLPGSGESMPVRGESLPGRGKSLPGRGDFEAGAGDSGAGVPAPEAAAGPTPTSGVTAQMRPPDESARFLSTFLLDGLLSGRDD